MSVIRVEAGQVMASGAGGRYRSDELLNGEIFSGLNEAQIVIEQWRIHYNTIRPHSALGYRPPAPQTLAPSISPLDGSLAIW